MCKTVPREQGHLDFLLPVLPLAEPKDGRKQVLNAQTGQPITHKFFVPRARADSIPAGSSNGPLYNLNFDLQLGDGWYYECED